MKLQHIYWWGWWGSVLIFLSLAGCDRQEPFPVFLDLKSPKVALGDKPNQLTTEGIKDLWIEHNADNLGVFKIPRVVPLLQDEVRDQLAIFGGVFENGLSAFRVRYPFWQPIIMELPDLTPLDTFPLDLTFRYFPDTVLAYPLNETFEGASFSFDSQSLSSRSTLMLSTISDVFQGSQAGKVVFTPEQNDFEIISTEPIFLPQRGGNDIYVEIAYKNDVSFTAGLYYVTQSLQVGEIPLGVYFNTQMEDWNIVYLHINDQVRETPENAVFRLYLKANSGNQSGTLLLDNIRIVHFR